MSYTDNKEELADQLARQHSHSTAIEAGHEHHQEHDLEAEHAVEQSTGQEIEQAAELSQVDSTQAHSEDQGLGQGLGE